MTVQMSQLTNGMQVITEDMTGVETVSLGIWLPRGSRDEQKHENGMFHFIEHTLFKGTPTRGAREIAEEVEGYGGILDAYTAKEETCYSLKVRAVHLERTLGVLGDMLVNPSFRPEELDRERQVILEEIKMEEDNPEDVVYEDSVARFWQDHPISRPILGPAENVSAFSSDQVREFHKRFYTTDQLVVAAAGKLSHDHICKNLEALFPNAPTTTEMPERVAPKVTPTQIYLHKKHLEQVNFCLHFSAASHTDENRHQLLLLNTLLGGGMSSRLFQSIREDRGLAYHISSFLSPYSDCGQLSIYGGCSPEKLDEVFQQTLVELERLKQEPVTAKELDRAREQCNSSLVMGLETTGARASGQAREYLTMGRTFDVYKALEELSDITIADVQQAACETFSSEHFGLSALGRISAKGPKKPWVLSN